MRFEINIPQEIIKEVRDKKDGKPLFDVINALMQYHVYYDAPRSGEYESSKYFGTITETIEPIGYRINVSKSPTLEDGNKKGA